MKTDFLSYKTFFFDFDGVIVESLSIKTQAFGDLFKRYGAKIQKQVMAYHRNNGGVSRYAKFRYYYEHLLHRTITPDIIDALDKQFSSLVTEKVKKAPFISGVEVFLSNLKRHQKKCFIISATPQQEIKDIVESKNLAHFFIDIVGSPRTKKENLGFLIERHRIDVNGAVYFGDAKSDFEAARIYDIDFVGVGGKESVELNKLKGIGRIKNFTYYLRKEVNNVK